ncbi:glycoside hydrolase family 16 protein [Maribellus mangrovi]|uniref:glycoside hydrolase family 16 protein n=1 Tax=Maribellus mangrovi TaxID=3133146 RepID=UPI0030EF4BF0
MTNQKMFTGVAYSCLLLMIIMIFLGVQSLSAQDQTEKSYFQKNVNNKKVQLVWHDEFDIDGKPDPKNWNYEYGFVRNRELQWYQPQNAFCKDGLLIIEGRREEVKNPDYDRSSNDWRTNRERAAYTSSCVITRELQEWPVFGYYEVRARISTDKGAWPAIWLLGTEGRWPGNGEIDMMEFYRINDVPHILANVAWASSQRYKASWDDSKHPFSKFTEQDPDWDEKFHTWSMTWDESNIRLYLDDELLNEVDLSKTVNPDQRNPFTSEQKFYLLLNMAIGSNGGDPSETDFPIQFEIDYARVYRFIDN